MEMLTESVGINDNQLAFEGDDTPEIFFLYTDRSKLDGNSGYGAVLYNEEGTILCETWGSKG